MKKTLLSLCCILFLGIIQAQVIPVGNFEAWDDLSDKINEDTDLNLEDGSVIVPRETFPLLTAFFYSFSEEFDIKEAVANSTKENMSTNVIGIDQSTEARSGDYALKFGGSNYMPITHLGYFSVCEGSKPKGIAFYYKHKGETTDSLYILATLGSKADPAMLLTGIDTASIGVMLDDTIIASGNMDEYQYVSFDFQDLNPDVNLDTLNLHFGAQNVKLDTSIFWLIDDLQYTFQTPTFDIDQTVLFRLGQSINNHKIYPFMDHNKVQFKRSTILSINGQNIRSFNAWHDEIGIEDLQAGKYVFLVETKTGKTFSKLFVKY